MRLNQDVESKERAGARELLKQSAVDLKPARTNRLETEVKLKTLGKTFLS